MQLVKKSQASAVKLRTVLNSIPGLEVGTVGVDAALHGPPVAAPELVHALVCLQVHMGPVTGDRVDSAGCGLELQWGFNQISQ